MLSRIRTSTPSVEQLLIDREARGLRTPLVVRLVLFSIALVLFLFPLIPASVRLKMFPFLLLTFGANVYGLRCTYKKVHLKLVGYGGVILDSILVSLVPVNMHLLDLQDASPLLITKSHFPLVCATMIAINGVSTRPAYPLIATAAAIGNYIVLSILSLVAYETHWTLDLRTMVTSDGVAPHVIGMSIVILGLMGFALTAFNRSMRMSVVAAAQNEAAHAMERQRHAQAVMEAKMQSLVKLVAGVSHEINTPLGAVQSNTTTQRRALERLRTEEATEDGPKRERALEAMRSTIDTNNAALARISEVVSNLNSFARVDEAEYKLVDVRELVTSALSLVPQNLRDNVESEEVFEDVPKISCYASALSQALLTVITNAFEAIDGSGTVKICVRAGEEEIIVEICDDGRGIPADQLEEIFDVRFQRGGPRVNASFGLPICQAVVLRHGGRIDVESREGDGTMFSIVLPQ